MEKTEQGNLQEKYILLQLVASQLMELEKEAQTIDQRKNELVDIRRNLDGLDKNKSARGFSALGLGMYIPSMIASSEDILINVGANIFINKKQADVKLLLDSQIEQAQLAVNQIIQNMQLLEARAMELQRELKQNV